MKPASEMSFDELSEVYPRLAALKAWVAEVEARVQEEAAAGRIIKDHKMVAGRAFRKWSAEFERLAPESCWKKVLLGIGEAEEKFGKDHPVFAKFAVKSAGKPVLVHVSDNRKPIETAKEFFK